MMLNYLPFLSSIMLVLAFRFNSLGWIAFFALVPLLIFIQYANNRDYSSKKKFWYLYSSSIVFWVFLTSWVIGVKPQLWAGIAGNTVGSLVFMTWLMVILFWGLGSAFISYFLSRKTTKLENYSTTLIIFPLLWALVYYLNSWLFSFVVYGKGGTLGPFWNFGNLGFQLADTSLGFVSRFIGLFGSEALVVLINVAIYYAFLKKYRPIVMTLIIASSLSFLSFLIYQPNGKNINVAAMQIKSGDNGKYLPKIQKIALDNKLSGKNISLFVIPESISFFTQPQSSLYATSVINNILNKSNGFSVAGGEASTDNYKSERIIYRDKNSNKINEQEKNFLIPGGEYSPNELNSMFSLLNKNNLRTQYQVFRVVKKGRHPEYPFKYNSIYYGTLSCSGIIAPQLYQEMTKKGANILVDSSELDILRNSPNFFNQTRQIARFQTIANSRPFVQATYGGYSYIFDANGNTKTETTNFDTNIISETVKTSSRVTVYSKYGEIIVPISIIVLAYFGLGLNTKARKASRSSLRKQ